MLAETPLPAIGTVLRLARAQRNGVKFLIDMHAMPCGSSDGTYNGVFPADPQVSACVRIALWLQSLCTAALRVRLTAARCAVLLQCDGQGARPAGRAQNDGVVQGPGSGPAEHRGRSTARPGGGQAPVVFSIIVDVLDGVFAWGRSRLKALFGGSGCGQC